MYEKGIIIWTCLMLWIAGIGLAQPVCGTVGERAEETIARLLRNKRAVSEGADDLSRDLIYLPVTFHLVAKNDGQGRVSPGRVLDMVCRLNADFFGTDLQFYIRKFTFLNNTLIYNDHTNADALMLALRDPHSINVWLLQDATPEGPTIENGLVQGYYTFNDATRDWIVMRRSEANGTATTLTHELGHFFSLQHPFRGWDNDPYDPAVHGAPAPAVSPGGQPTELMSGNNCQTAADLLCDTPPDYNSGFGWENCDYIGAEDPEGVPIDPEERLFMSYFNQCDRDDYFFSEMQQNIIVHDVQSQERTYIREAPTVPTLTPINETTQLIAPADESALNPVDPVTFAWSAVNGADQYLLEIDITPSFVTPLLRQLIVAGNSRTVTGLQLDRNYYWRVRPFNNYQTCTEYSELRTFTTSEVVAVQDIPAIADWSLGPNPAHSGEQITLRLRNRAAFTGTVQLLDLGGTPVQHYVKQYFGAGTRQFSLDLEYLPGGAYIFSLRSESGGRLTAPIIVIP